LLLWQRCAAHGLHAGRVLYLQLLLLTSDRSHCIDQITTRSTDNTAALATTTLYTHTLTVAAGADVDACDAHGDSVLKFAFSAPPPGAMLRALRAAAQFNNSVNFATASSDAPPPTVAATRPRRCSIGSSSSATGSSSKGRKLSGVLKSSSSSDNDITTSTATAGTASVSATSSSDSDSKLVAQEQRRVRFSVDLSISGELGAGGLGALQQRGAWRAR
jgi:hypothetical protein